MKVAIYNVNGINGRLPILLRWLQESEPDIVCLQELKAPAEKFPEPALNKLDYHAIWHGQKAWNGVAILAKAVKPVETRRGLPGDPNDLHSRYIEAAIGGIIIGCLYLPNGNPAPGPKFSYKLGWFERLHEHAAALLKTGHPVIMAGDFNVMPTDLDVYPAGRCSQPLCVQPHEIFIGDNLGMVQRAMPREGRRPLRRLRYEAGPFRGMDCAWMVFDECGDRLVACLLTQHEALTLAHTLNVADLRASAADFNVGSWWLPRRQCVDAHLARLVGRESVIAGTDCGFSQSWSSPRMHEQVQWAKLEPMVEGARLAAAVELSESIVIADAWLGSSEFGTSLTIIMSAVRAGIGAEADMATKVPQDRS